MNGCHRQPLVKELCSRIKAGAGRPALKALQPCYNAGLPTSDSHRFNFCWCNHRNTNLRTRTAVATFAFFS